MNGGLKGLFMNKQDTITTMSLISLFNEIDLGFNRMYLFNSFFTRH